MAEFASKGVAGTALGLGAGALGVELLRGGLGGLFGGMGSATVNVPLLGGITFSAADVEAAYRHIIGA